MCNPTREHKVILNRINTYDLNAIHDFIKKHKVQLSCLIEYGISSEKLCRIDEDLLRQLINEENVSSDRLRDAGMPQSQIDHLYGSDKKGGKDPDGEEDEGPLFPPPEPTKLHPVLQRIQDGKANVLEIQSALEEEEITIGQLRDRCGLSNDMIRRIQNFSFTEMSFININDLPPIQKDRTDFYFLGLKGSGKSCMIASLLAYWHREGLGSINVNNQRSIEYQNILGGGFSDGILPGRTTNDFIDYIEYTLHIKKTTKKFLRGEITKNYEIPINILDMAGEKFEAIAAGGGGKQFTEHKEYLLNDNLKTIFFVIDYSADNYSNGSSWRQPTSLEIVLNTLDKMGILSKTESIYVVVTKADMFQVALSDYAKEALEYTKENYKAFMNTLIRLEKQHGFEWSVIPYSIGKCSFGQLLNDYNHRTNENLKIYPALLSDKIIEGAAKYSTDGWGWLTN